MVTYRELKEALVSRRTGISLAQKGARDNPNKIDYTKRRNRAGDSSAMSSALDAAAKAGEEYRQKQAKRRTAPN